MLKPEHIQFIKNNLDKDITQLVLKGIPFNDVTVGFIAEQISARQRLKKKLPSWIQNENAVFPKKINLAQSSSEKTAHYKSEIIKKNKLVCDLTGGFGVDAFALANVNEQVFHVEKNKDLVEMVNHNKKQFQLENLKSYHESAESFLENLKTKVDWFYIDPSRRDQNLKKVFLFEDCEPNLINLLPLLKEKSDYALIKTSPLIDISYGIKTLKYVRKVHAVSLGNELKELLWELDFSKINSQPEIVTLQILKYEKRFFNFRFNASNYQLKYAKPLNYLYEPNSALMKVGDFNHLAEMFQLKKLHPNSHLFTSEKIVNDFPGRVFNIEQVLDYKPKLLKKELKNIKTNVSTRNFPIVAKDLISLFKIKEGGEKYAFFTTDNHQQKIYISCTKAY